MGGLHEHSESVIAHLVRFGAALVSPPYERETAISNETNAARIVSSEDITLDWKRDIRFEWNGKASRVILEFTEYDGFQTFWLDERNNEIEEPSRAPLSTELYRLALEWESLPGTF